MNSKLAQLHDYPFQKLAQLLKDVEPNRTLSPIALSVGEPKHPAPDFVLRELADNLVRLSVYPTTRGLPELRQAVAEWATGRFTLPGNLDPEHQVLPVSGTREALFSFTQAVVDSVRGKSPVVIMPNPFYQIYEGAVLLAGAEPYYLNTTAENGFVPDIDSVPDAIWNRTQLFFYCSPGNPTGKVLSEEWIGQLLGLAAKHDFIIAADECYSEIYFDEAQPPPGLLQVAAASGNDAYRRCVAFHSLSKRSNLPGLRSGFVAGDGHVLDEYFKYRTYHGATLSNSAQVASIAAWRDEQHVVANRDLYRKKFEQVIGILSPVLAVDMPDAGFYLWLDVPWGDELCAKELVADQNVKVLPGSYLSRQAAGINPGKNRVRIALVASLDECLEAAQRIRRYIELRN